MKAWESIFERAKMANCMYVVVVVRDADGERKVAYVPTRNFVNFTADGYLEALHGPWLLGTGGADWHDAAAEATRQAQRLDLDLLDYGEKFEIDKTYSTLV